MDGVHLSYQVLAQVILRDFKLTKKIKTIIESHFLLIKNWNNETSTFVFGILLNFYFCIRNLTQLPSLQETKSLATHPLAKHPQRLIC